ncbi:nuclear transport factor 2 family protein [Arenimonas alkanexedens]
MLLLVGVAGCSREPPEEALRATIAEMQAAAEARDSSALVDSVAEDFAGPGNMDRDQFRRYLALIWLRNREVAVRLGPLDVELLGERARVNFTAATTGGEGFLPDRADVYQVRTGWRLDDGEWMLISAEWE